MPLELKPNVLGIPLQASVLPIKMSRKFFFTKFLSRYRLALVYSSYILTLKYFTVYTRGKQIFSATAVQLRHCSIKATIENT